MNTHPCIAGNPAVTRGDILLYITWLSILSIPNIIYALRSNLIEAIHNHAWSIALIALLASWLRRSRVTILLLLPFYALLPAELYYIATYHHPSTSHIIGVIHETNIRETHEYLGTVPLAGLAISTFVLVIFSLYLARKDITLPRTRSLLWIRLFSLGLVLALLYAELDLRNAEAQSSAFDEEPLDTASMRMRGVLIEGFPQGVPLRVAEYLSDLKQRRDAAAKLSKWDFHVTSTPPKEQIVVLVIGESSNPSHWGINGYHRNTTPSLSKTPGVVSLRNVISPHSATRRAVPSLLTGTSPINWTHGSLITLFKQAGFSTAWLSNQSPTGVHDSTIGLYAHEADEVMFINPVEYMHKGRLDGDLIPIFNRIIRQENLPKFIVVHLLGSHKAYQHRYPDNFDIFTPSLKSHPDDERIQTLVNTYDNSIAYTDHVLSSMIQSLQNLDEVSSVLLYVSDHGENLPHGSCLASGHGLSNEDDFRVSSIVWLSSLTQAEHPEWLATLQSRKDAPLHTTEIFPTLADLASITYDGLTPERSWLRHEYRPLRARHTEIVSDFDRALRTPPCATLKMPH